MKPLYLSPTVRSALSEELRPGGRALTERLIKLVNPCKRTILDAGCGAGTSLVRLQQEKPKAVIGIDTHPALLAAAQNKGIPALRADMASLPLRTNSVDLVFSECAWNLSNQRTALEEFHRVLRPSGHLALADIYHRTPGKIDAAWPVSCCFAAAREMQEIKTMLNEQGFIVEQLEDHTPLLQQTAANFVFQHGSIQGFWEAVTGSAERAEEACAAGKATRPGLFLILARACSLT